MQEALGRAIQLSSAGRPEAALEEFDRALDEFGPCIELLYNRGVTFQRLGRHQEAILSFSQVTEATVRSAPVHFGMGVSYQALGDARKAIRAYDDAVRLFPGYPEALNNRGIVYQILRQWDEAIDSHRLAVEAEPSFAEAHNSLGAALHSAGRDEEALVAIDRAIALSPNFREAWNNRGVTLQGLGRYEEALASFDKALDIAPTVSGLTHRANCLADLGRLDEADREYSTALLHDDAYPMARFNRSLVALQRGDFETGWRDYEFRSLTAQGDPIPVNAASSWDGSVVKDKTIYVRSEQGAGDTIQFMRYLKFVKERCGKVVFECSRDVAPLAACCEGVDEIVVKQDSSHLLRAPAGSIEVFLLSLPHVFETTVDTIPALSKYISVWSNRRNIWRMRILQSREIKPGFRIAIVWAGAASHKNDRARSCRLDDFGPLADIEGVHLYSLQKGRPAQQLYRSGMGRKVIDLRFGLLDYGDTAAALENFDLVVSVDTSVAHLAGALGIPVWTVLPTSSDWRWMLDREDSPWYPTMRLFRQKSAGDWSEVFERVRAGVIELVKPVDENR